MAGFESGTIGKESRIDIQQFVREELQKLKTQIDSGITEIRVDLHNNPNLIVMSEPVILSQVIL